MSNITEDEERAEAFAEGMEAAHCGLLMKDGPRGRKIYAAWSAGYIRALIDRGAYCQIKPRQRGRRNVAVTFDTLPDGRGSENEN